MSDTDEATIRQPHDSEGMDDDESCCDDDKERGGLTMVAATAAAGANKSSHHGTNNTAITSSGGTTTIINISDVHRMYKEEENQQEASIAASGADVSLVSVLSTGVNLFCRQYRALVVALLVLLIGAGASGAFWGLGLSNARSNADEQFERRSTELVNAIGISWNAYEVAGLHVHEQCRHGCTRLEFREHYEYMISTGLEFQVTSYNPNVTQADRAALEAESAAFYREHHPEIDYRGIVGLEPNADEGGLSVQPRSADTPVMFPVHYLEPIRGNEGAIDFDLYSSASRRRTIHAALSTWKPALTPRLSLVQETDPNAYSVILFHPGTPLSTQPDLKPRDFSSMVVRIPDLLKAATRNQAEPTSVFIYDGTNYAATTENNPEQQQAPPAFLGGVTVHPNDDNGKVGLTYEPEIELSHLRNKVERMQETDIAIATSTTWIVAVVAVDGTDEPDIVFVVLGGVIILLASACVSIWLYTSIRRQERINLLRAHAEAEKAAIVVESATNNARAQRDLNDFIAHEVRNPLAAALSACSFVNSAVNEREPLTEERRVLLQDDVGIIEASLQFINDLLRNMLDMQRASSNQLQIENTPTDILQDIFRPVDSMLYRRDDTFEVQIECPEGLAVLTDRLRLKQIMLNLGRNSSKFVQEGFIRFRAVVVEGGVELYVEDSGPGIPESKRKALFRKFQESLDMLAQGTGIGLNLCKRLCGLMGADLSVANDYDSGVPGCPGTCFVIKLNKPPIALDEFTSTTTNTDAVAETAALMLNGSPTDNKKEQRDSDATHVGSSEDGDPAVFPNEESDLAFLDEEAAEPKLPENMSVLFVDDDMILRKLFVRSVRRVAPGWTLQEAANGETAIRLATAAVAENNFDLIFMDQYMASVEKQLLGTETVRALRSRGVTSIICGLSANDSEHAFLLSGADAFLFKPFPCESQALERELLRIVSMGRRKGR